MRLWQRLRSLPASLVIFIIVGLRPLLGPATCRYSVSCTQFARQTLREQPFFYALYAITKRLLSCIG